MYCVSTLLATFAGQRLPGIIAARNEMFMEFYLRANIMGLLSHSCPQVEHPESTLRFFDCVLQEPWLVFNTQPARVLVEA